MVEFSLLSCWGSSGGWSLLISDILCDVQSNVQKDANA